MTDENVLNTEQDEHSIVVFDEKGESGRTEHVVHHLLSRSTRRAFLSIHPPPLCIPRRLFSAYYSVRRGCKACLLLTVSSEEAVISPYTRELVEIVSSRLGFWILSSIRWILRRPLARWYMLKMIKNFHSKNWKGCLKRDGSECWLIFSFFLKRIILWIYFILQKLTYAVTINHGRL